ncbi:MAG: hypothetical protein MJ181_11400 [Treponema sp.]|nr:hypothetical protein [Treponema sp.]
MEIENVNSKANAGLTTGIIGTAGLGLALLSHGLGGWGFGGNGLSSGIASGLCSAIPSAMENTVGRNELEHRLSDIQTIAEKDSQIAELKMNSLMDSKVLDLYKYVENNLHAINDKFASQGVWNAAATGQMSFMASQIADLKNVCSSITKTVVPIDSVCPEPMPLKNSWTAPTN